MTTEAPVRLVAITGGSGAGKSWLADRLQILFGRTAGRLSLDSFYRGCAHLPPAARDRLNFDDPAAIDWPCFAGVLDSLRRNRACRVPRYDFGTHTRRDESDCLPPRPLVIVDGLWLLHHPDIRRLFDLTVFLHCTEEERLRRRLARDGAERQRSEASVREQFRSTVAPMHAKYVSPQAAHADLLLHHPLREMELLQLQERLSRLVPVTGGTCERLLLLLRPDTFHPAAAPAGLCS